MEKVTVKITKANASYRELTAGDGKATDLFIPKEYYDFFHSSSYDDKVEVCVNKRNLYQALLFVCSVLPKKYDRSTEHKIVDLSREFIENELNKLDAFFTSDDGEELKETCLEWQIRFEPLQKNGKVDSRFYFNNLIKDIEYKDYKNCKVLSKFTIRDYLVGGYSSIEFTKRNDGKFDCLILNSQYSDNTKSSDLDTLEINLNDVIRQAIFYGAPGTGKSHCVSEITKGHEVIRTTFHPDYDYASFVGAYKPVSEKISNQNNSQSNSSEQIVYRFIAQPFLNAYVEAWKKLCSEEEQDKSVFLVIEELNRGNCAQIFGDVFQLLDRKDNGFSDYSISCDSDIQKYLAESFQYLAFEKLTYIEQIYSKEPSILEELKTGKKLVLPSNLYIYATMNTSDQSLFPIDSAFKRRWSWNYVPITQGVDENGGTIDVSIQIENEKYDWWDFISKINERIESVTNSEDKKLGFFFCEARNGIITADEFVGKVLFYIWNDVFKDYGFDDEIFKLNDKCERLKFSSFYEFVNNKTQPNCAAIRTFLKNLGIAIKENTEIGGNKNDSDSEDSATNAISSSVNNSDDSDSEGTTES